MWLPSGSKTTCAGSRRQNGGQKAGSVNHRSRVSSTLSWSHAYQSSLYRDIDIAFFVCMVELWTADGTENVTMIPQPSAGPPPTFKRMPATIPGGTQPPFDQSLERSTIGSTAHPSDVRDKTRAFQDIRATNYRCFYVSITTSSYPKTPS